MASQPQEVGARLRAVREARYRNRDDAAADFRRRRDGTTAPNTFMKWEKGAIGVADLLDLCQMLDCDPCWVLTGEGEPVADTEKLETIYANLAEILRKLEADQEVRDLRGRLRAAEDEGQDPPADATGASRGR